MSETAQFNIHNSNQLTRNVQPILHEIYHALRKLLETGESSIIDLRSIPLAPSEEETIIDTLGCGEVHARLNALGPSEIYETQYAGVWLVTHYNETNSIVSRFIEISHVGTTEPLMVIGELNPRTMRCQLAILLKKQKYY